MSHGVLAGRPASQRHARAPTFFTPSMSYWARVIVIIVASCILCTWLSAYSSFSTAPVVSDGAALLRSARAAETRWQQRRGRAALQEESPSFNPNSSTAASAAAAAAAAGDTARTATLIDRVAAGSHTRGDYCATGGRVPGSGASRQPTRDAPAPGGG